jgi:hypothetical protein
VEEGGSLVTVAVRDGEAAEVASALNHLGAKRVAVYGDTGWMT